MQIRSKIISFFTFLLLYSYSSTGQDSTLQVQLNKSFFRPGDTIFIKASQQSKVHSTLFLMAEHENGFVWEMRWPMLKGISEPRVIIPDSMPPGQYRLFFSVLQNLFTVFGKVKTPDKIEELSATLLTAAGDVYENEIPVNDSGIFTYRNVLFEDSATLVFTHADKRNNDNLDIEISTVLDSVSYPLRNKITDIYIGQHAPEPGMKKFISINSNPEAKAQVLETVTVYTRPRNRGELFNKKYSSGLFKDMNERVFSFLDDPMLSNSISVFQTLRSRVAGLNIIYGINPVAIWRGQPVIFYLDEMRVPASVIDGVPAADVAIIKVYPPPFFGNTGGNGGAVAVYTKRGGLSDDNYKNAFRVKGYTPFTFRLPTMPDRF
jgi:hypothetical protein